MFQQTLQKRVLFPRTLALVMVGGFVVLTVISALFLGRPQYAAAATNSNLNFQARLENAAGNIVPDGYYNVQFKLYSGGTAGGPAGKGQANAGTNLWTETWYDSNGATAGNDNRIQVRNGYVTANLGSQTAFPSINWDEELWITMNIGGTTQTATPTWDGEMNPRMKLTGVPYAFKAGQLATTNAANDFTSTLSILQPTVGNQVFQIQDQAAAGTYNLCIQNSTACGFAASSGSANYVQNQNASQQTSSNFWISGTGRADTALQAPSFDTPTAVALNIGTTNATSIVLGKAGVNTRVAANLSVGTTQSFGAITVANDAWFSAVDSAGTGSVNMFKVNASNQIQVGAALNVDGGIILPTNGGQMTLVDLGIDSAASSGAKQSYTFRVGSTNALTVYGEADGSGNSQNVRVAIGSSISPAYTLDVGGDINTSGDLRTGTTSRISSTGVLQNVTANANILTSGTLSSSVVSGSYTGITGVGTLTVGTWNATAIVDTYIGDTLTVDSSSSVAWAALNTYPSACGAGTAITALGDTPTCSAFATTDTNTTYSAGGDLDLTGTTFSIEAQLDDVTTISRASSSLTLQTTTSGNIILNSAGTIELQDNTNVTGALTATSTITGTTLNGTTGINTGASAGTQRIDASGNLVNIGTITSGLINGQTISSAANFTGTVGVTTSITAPTLQNAGTLNLSATGANQIDMNTNGSLRWSVLSGGQLEGNGASTIRTTTGDLTLATNGGNGNIVVTPNGTGYTNLSAGGFRIGGTEVITSGRVLQNVTTNTSILTAGTLGVDRGGTGLATATLNGVVFGNGTSAMGVTAAGSTGQCLIATTGSAPTWGSCGAGTTYSAGNDLDLTGTTFDIESQLDSVSTISRASSALTLQTTTSGNIILNSAGTIELQDNTNVTGALTVSSTINTNTFTSTALTFAGAGATTIQAASGQSLTVQSQGAGGLILQSGSGTVSLGSSTVMTATGALTVRSTGATAMAVDAGGAAGLNLGTTNANAVTIGNVTNTATTTVIASTTLNLGANANNKTIHIGATGSTANTTTVNIANSTGAAQTVVLGSTNTTSTTTIQGGSGNIILNSGGTIELQDNTNVTGTMNASTSVTTPLLDTASAVALDIGTTNATVINLNENVTVASGKTLTVNGAATFQNATNSASAFKIQNAAGTSLLNVDTTTDSTNLITNGSFEQNTTGWAARSGTASFARNTSEYYTGNASLSFASDASGEGVNYPIQLSPNTTYTFNGYIRALTSSASSFTAGYAADGSNEATYVSSVSYDTGGWGKFSVQFTTPGTVNAGAYLFLKTTTGVARSFAIDSVRLHLGSTATAPAYRESTILLNGIITSPFYLQNAVDSTRAFSVERANGADVFEIDTLNNKTNVGGVLEVTGLANLNGGVTVAAGQYISLVGGITGTRPASPTAGMLYFDTTTQQLLVYSNSKWQADRSTATKIVADGSTTQNPDSADFVVPAAATNAEVTINAAIAALPGGGGTVVLREGTYTVSGAIDLPSNVTLAGAGPATVLKVVSALSSTTFGVIENADQVSGNSYITIRDLKIDGNRSNQTVGTHHGIYMVKAGSGSGTTNNALPGVTISSVWVEYMRTAGMRLNITNSTVQKSYIHDNGSYGIWLDVAVNNVINGNIIQDNAGNGIQSDGASAYNVISGNMIEANTARGVYLDGSTSYTSVEGNTIIKNSDEGVSLNGVSNNTISDNKFHDNSASSSKSTIMLLGTGSGNSVTGNTITDTAGTGYAINVSVSTISSTYLSGNTFSGTGAASINDVGSATVYGSQISGTGMLMNRSTGGTNIQTTAGQDILLAQPSSTPNLLTNPGFDTNTTGWAATGTGATISRTTTKANVYSGQGALQVNLGSVASTGVQISAAGISGGTQPAGTYTFSFYAQSLSLISGLAVSFSGGGTCTLSATTISSEFVRYSCTVTTSGATTSISLTASSTSLSFDLDAVQLEAAATASLYDIGRIQFNGIIDAPMILQNSSNSVNAFRIQEASGFVLMNVDSISRVVSFGSGTGFVRMNLDNNEMTIGSGLLIDNNGNLSKSGNARNTVSVSLVPEYSGATMTGDNSNNTGTMTSDFCSGSSRLSIATSICASTDEHNYYSWTTAAGSDQDYDIYVRYQIPSDFDGFSSNTSIKAFGWRTDATNNKVEVTMFNAAGGTCQTVTNVATGTATWTETATAGNETSDAACTAIAANDVVIFRIKLTATTSEFARAGAIRFDYYSSW